MAGDNILDAGGSGAAPAPVATGVTGAGGGQSQGLDDLTKQILQRVLTPRMGLGQPPTAKPSAQSMTPQGYNMNVGYGRTPGEAKRQDMGIGLQNLGTMMHNFAAEIKQRQVKQGYHDWQVLDDAVVRAQEAVVMQGKDPQSADGQKMMQEVLEKTLKGSVLDPTDPKAQKRLKNMYKALNVDPFEPNTDNNAHREGLKQFFHLKKAKQQAMSAQQAQQHFQANIQGLMNRTHLQPTDPKVLESAAGMLERRHQHEESMALHRQQLAEQISHNRDQMMRYQQQLAEMERWHAVQERMGTMKESDKVQYENDRLEMQRQMRESQEDMRLLITIMQMAK